MQDPPFTLNLAFKLPFTISAPVNGGMSDWFIHAQILKFRNWKIWLT